MRTLSNILQLGLKELRFSVTVHFGGANGITGLQAAAMAVATGVARHVVVVSGRNGYSGSAKISTRPSLPAANFAATREWEWRQWLDGVTDWELKRYFEII